MEHEWKRFSDVEPPLNTTVLAKIHVLEGKLAGKEVTAQRVWVGHDVWQVEGLPGYYFTKENDLWKEITASFCQ